MVDDTFIRAFRKPIYLLNTARGGVVKTADLVKNLKRGKVLGAALDVLEFEKSSFEELHGTEQMPAYFNELIALDNVILSPHVAGWTEESNLKISEVIAKKILQTFSG
jgi:D-3-phosphoglycerate dehydrogenase